jgi:Sulfatase
MPKAEESGMKSDQQQKTTWMHGAAMLTVWLPVLAFVCLSIFARIQSKYFAGLLVASGINGDPSLRDILFLYRQDLIIFGVIVPLLTAWCFVKLRFSLAAAISAVLVLLIQVLLYANMQSWGQVGSFLTWQAMRNAMSFGMSNPEFVGEYISVDGVVKLSVLILLSLAVLVAGRLLWRQDGLIRLWGRAGWLSVAACALLSAYGYTSHMRTAPISSSFVVNAVSALADSGTSLATPPPASELSARYAQLAHISQAAYQGPNFGVHKGSNLLLFVMETASIEFLDTRKGMPAHPALDALKSKMYVATNHFSTFPASAEANLSILTGAYPPRAIYGTCLIDVPRTGGRLPGPIVQLRDAGYKTAIYAPYQSQVPADKVIFEGTGFEKVVYGTSLAGSGNADERTFDQLSKDIAGWAGSKQPFAAAFLPQVGHGPWPAALGATVQERGARIVRDQLDWLGRIVETLRATGQLDNTVIILTGDHGVRTSLEDPRVKVGMIDWYSFHVPLLLYAPRADYANLDTGMPSSHVDLSAELDELFGMPTLPSFQGLAFHNPERKGRRGFLMAGWYYGANGYRDPTETAMYSDMLDAVYARSDGKVEFGTGQLITDNRRRAAIRGRLSAMTSLQEAWIADRLCPKRQAEAGK